MYFAYGEEETDYLKKKDKRMAEVIDRIGHVERKVDTDLFSAVVHHIVGQQISTKAQETVWQRMLSALGEVSRSPVPDWVSVSSARSTPRRSSRRAFPSSSRSA